MQTEIDLVKKSSKLNIEMMEDFIQLKKVSKISKNQDLNFDYWK